MGAEVEIEAPDAAGIRAAAPILARAFLDDPIWTAVGPRMRAHRALTNRVSFWGTTQASARSGARIRVARAGDAVIGATIAFEPGSWPPPQTATLWELPWALVAGPLPACRGVRAERAMHASHVAHPHMYLWFIAVEPQRHGSGVGTALMAELHADSDARRVPTYLETGTEANVGFYSALGYEVIGEIAMPAGMTMWRMERPAPG